MVRTLGIPNGTRRFRSFKREKWENITFRDVTILKRSFTRAFDLVFNYNLLFGQI